MIAPQKSVPKTTPALWRSHLLTTGIRQFISVASKDTFALQQPDSVRGRPPALENRLPPLSSANAVVNLD